MIKGQLKLIVLKTLSEREVSGYSIMKHIEKATGWKPSTGSVYPLLDELLVSGDVKVRKKDRKKLYRITVLGKEKLKKLMDTKEEILSKLVEGIRLFQYLFPKDDKIKSILDYTKGRIIKLK